VGLMAFADREGIQVLGKHLAWFSVFRKPIAGAWPRPLTGRRRSGTPAPAGNHSPEDRTTIEQSTRETYPASPNSAAWSRQPAKRLTLGVIPSSSWRKAGLRIFSTTPPGNRDGRVLAPRALPGAIVGAAWNTADIWIRREFSLPNRRFKDLHIFIHHDEDAEIYLNGVLTAKVAGFIFDYEEVPISKALATLRPGKNRIVVHCKQTTGGQ
jgi:hypothetical protein